MPANGGDAPKQGRILRAFHQPDQSQPHFDGQGLDAQERFHVIVLGGGRFGGVLRRRSDLRQFLLAHAPTRGSGAETQQKEGQLRHSGQRGQRHQHSARQHDRLRISENLLVELGPKPRFAAGPGYDQGARNGNHQRRDDRHQAVTDGEHRVRLDRLAKIHPVLQHADQEAGNNVDRGDQNAGHGIALGEARRAVHGAVEFGFGGQRFAPPLGFDLVDQAGIQIAVDRHLLAGQGIQGEARRNFADAHRAVIDDHVLNRDQHQEDHRADHIVAAHHETTERADHLAGGRCPGVAVDQNQARAGDVQRQAEQRQQQQSGGKRGEFHRSHQVQGHHQYDHRHQNVDHDQQVQNESRQRRDQRDHDGEHRQRHDEFAQRLHGEVQHPFRQAAGGPRCGNGFRWRHAIPASFRS